MDSHRIRVPRSHRVICEADLVCFSRIDCRPHGETETHPPEFDTGCATLRHGLFVRLVFDTLTGRMVEYLSREPPDASFLYWSQTRNIRANRLSHHLAARQGQQMASVGQVA